MSTHLFNRDANGEASQIPLGGLPYYNDDVMDLQNNIVENFGVGSILKGYSCILGGCLVDEVNTDTQTIKVTPGTVFINDVAVDFPGYEGTYPFSIQLIETDVDSRAFKVGQTFDVGKEYSTAIRTNFTFAAGTSLELSLPTDLASDEIFFWPFTAQRSEHILKSLSTSYGEFFHTIFDDSITKTETGKSIVGTPLKPYTSDGYGRWKYLGYRSFNALGNFGVRNRGSEPVGSLLGDNEFKIAKNQLPKHQHDEDFNGTLLTYDGANNGFNGSHEHKLVDQNGDVNSAPKAGAEEVKSGSGSGVNGDEFNFITGTEFSGKHVHGIGGKTGDRDSSWGANQSTVDVRGRALNANSWAWFGYQSVSSFYNFYTGVSNVLPYSNM